MQNLTIEEAEKAAGKRLDRRHKYFMWEGQVCFDSAFVHACSGCFEGGEYGGMAHHYPWDDKHKIRIGCGCDECGYSGKRVGHFPVPHNYKEIEAVA